MIRRLTATTVLLVSLLACALGGCAYAVSAMMSKLAQTSGPALSLPRPAGTAVNAARDAGLPVASRPLQVVAGAASPPAPGPTPQLGTTGFADTSLPGSSVVNGEPSLLLAAGSNVVVTGPSGIGHSSTVSASPAWISSDGGRSFRGPVSTETGGQDATGIGGGDSDIVADKHGNLYVTSLWLGNTSMAVSSDGGSTWTALPIGHLTPADDRPWLAYDHTSDALYMAWDGFDGIHVAKAVLRGAATGTAAAPLSGLVFAQDVVAVPEVASPSSPTESSVRDCACPPGTMAIDPQGGVHVAYDSQFGLGIASSDDGGLTWSLAYVPDSGDGKTQDLGNNFQVLQSDNQGNLYVVWSRAGGDGDVVFVSWLRAHTTTWHEPMSVSVTASGLFGTLAVPGPGVVDIAYYGTNDYPGDPNAAPAKTSWDIWITQLRDVFGSNPTALVADIYQNVHMGSISTGGLGGAADRSLGDFFSIAVDGSGMLGIATAVGETGPGTTLHYLYQTSPLVPAGPASAAVTAAPIATPSAGVPAYPYAYPYSTPAPQAGSVSLSPPPAVATVPGNGQAADAGTAAATPPPAPPPDIVALSRGGSRAPASPPTAVPLYLPIVLLLAVPAVLGALLLRLRRR